MRVTTGVHSLRPGGPPGTVNKQVGVHNIVPQVRTALLTQGATIGKLDGETAAVTGGTAGLDRLYDTVKREKGSLDVLRASAGTGEPARLGEITEAQFESRIPCGEAGRPDEIATAALFPASGDSGCGNGMELVAGGGTTAI
jgi:hypothetical protein